MPTIKKSEFLYRIVKWEHLVDLFETKKLFFARPSQWEDPYESRINHPAMNEVFALCWCRRGVSDAMWRIYSPENMGIRIKVRRTELVKQLSLAKNEVQYQAKKIGVVRYKRQSDIDVAHKSLVSELEVKYEAKKAFESLMYKRNAFNHEAETRVLLYAKDVPKDDKGLFVPVCPHSLIETILADPRMPESMYKALKYYMKEKIGFSGSFGKSTIYSAKDPLRVGYDDDEI